MIRTITIGLSLLAGGCAPTEKPPVGLGARAAAEVLAVEEQFAREADSLGIVPAFRERVGPEAILFLPDPTVINPRLKTAHWPGDLDWRPAFAVASSGGDLVLTAGPSAWTVNGRADLGYYFTIWRRQPDGAWRFIIDGNTPMTENLYARPAGATEILAASAPTVAQRAEAPEASLARELAVDARSAIAGRLDPRGRVLRAGAEPAVGRAAAAALLKAGPARLSSWTLASGTAVAGDLSYAYGAARWMEGGAEKRGYWNRVWRHGPDGWRIVFDQLNVRPET